MGRKGSHGAKTLALPGGHLEMNESWEECAKREVMEETGLEIHEMELVHVSNDIFWKEQKHYITLFIKAECIHDNAEAQNKEPHKCEGWESFSWMDFLDLIQNEEGDKMGDKMEERTTLFLPLKH